MQLFSTTALPIDKLLIGQSIPLGDLLQNAKDKPAHFALEAFAFVMMIVGAIVTCDWAYDLGKLLGSTIA